MIVRARLPSRRGYCRLGRGAHFNFIRQAITHPVLYFGIWGSLYGEISYCTVLFSDVSPDVRGSCVGTRNKGVWLTRARRCEW